MDDGDRIFRAHDLEPWPAHAVAPPFVAPDILGRADLQQTRKKLSSIIQAEVLPRLIKIHGESAVPGNAETMRPAQEEIVKLASLVLDPNIRLSADFVAELQERGFSMEGLFVHLLEPAARVLGIMWHNDECSFVDVTLGVGRLQQLLAMMSSSVLVPAFSEKRRVCVMSVANEQHFFGVSMVEKFLSAGGWDVRSERGTAAHTIASLLRSEWFAVVGLTASSDRQVELLGDVIRQIRRSSRNPVVGIMVGGPPFTENPELAIQVGADATAINAPSAVLLAQRLFDIGAATNWQNSFA